MPTSTPSAARSAASPHEAAKPQTTWTPTRLSLLAIPLLAVALALNQSRRAGPRVFSKTELARYVDKSLKVAICGQVFDVSKGAEFYAQGAGYAFFAGRDASLAFVTSNFKTNLTDDVSSLSDAQLLELRTWADETYHKKYIYEGVVVGYFYDAEGLPTQAHLQFNERVGRARKAAARQLLDVETYPDCASRRSQTERSVSCKTGRVPTKRRTEAGAGRCACVLETAEGLGPRYEHCTVGAGGRTSCALG